MKVLNVNGTEVSLTAIEIENKDKTKGYKITGKDSAGNIINGHYFSEQKRPNFTKHSDCILELEIIEGSGSLTYKGDGDELSKKIEVWFQPDEKDGDTVGGPVGPRGTEVTVNSGTGEY